MFGQILFAPPPQAILYLRLCVTIWLFQLLLPNSNQALNLIRDLSTWVVCLMTNINEHFTDLRFFVLRKIDLSDQPEMSVRAFE